MRPVSPKKNLGQHFFTHARYKCNMVRSTLLERNVQKNLRAQKNDFLNVFHSSIELAVPTLMCSFKS